MTRLVRLAVTVIVLPERTGLKSEVNDYLKVKQLLVSVFASKGVFLSIWNGTELGSRVFYRSCAGSGRWPRQGLLNLRTSIHLMRFPTVPPSKTITDTFHHYNSMLLRQTEALQLDVDACSFGTSLH
jgi:hypothetical protein